MRIRADLVKKHLKSVIIMCGVLIASFIISSLMQNVFNCGEQVTNIFMFAVFLVSFLTKGYIYGILTAFIGVLAVNYAFTFPYFDFSFSAAENIFSAVVMIVLSLMTSALTVKLTKWKTVKAESEKERMRANLLRAVSHDLRTPLTTIYGSSSAILDNYEILTDEQKRKMVTGIKEDSEWLIRMVENLLSVTRIDSGKVKIIKTPTVLEELVDSVLCKFKKRYPNRQVDIDIPEEMVVIPMDAILIEQVIVNILENAVQHAVGMTKLCFRVFVLDEKAIFEISDDGCGIEKERLDKIFTGYYNSEEQPSQTEKRNAGIGLSVCATIIKAHGGTITAQNSKGGGAVFRFSLDTEVNDPNEQQ